MVKTTLTKRIKNKQLQARKPPMKTKTNGFASRVNKAIIDYRRLLDDPCGAPMVNGPYTGIGSGYLARTKQMIFPSGSTGAVDFVVTIAPNTGTAGVATWGYSTTPGGNLGTASSNLAPDFLRSNTVGYYRCIASCAKIMYSGSEMNRAGFIGTNLATGQIFTTGELITGSAESFMARCARRVRLGDEAHEVRWLPSVGDDTFVSHAEPMTGTSITTDSVMTVVGTSVPAGSVSIELTCVWEWIPNMSLSGGMVADTKTPAPFTLNTVLSTIADAARWATDPAVQAKAGVFAKGIYNFTSRAAAAIALAV